MAAQRPVRFSVATVPLNTSWSDLRAVWQRADELGYYSARLPDHFYPGSGDVDTPLFECWTLLSALAACTKRIRLAPLVLSNTFRHPALLANMAATLDHVSDGRLILGIGAGWLQSEHEGYGIPLPPPRERIERFEEAIQVLRLLFTERRATFSGSYYQLADALCEPKPVQQPYPPLLIGGSGERRMLRVVARYADEWNGELGVRQIKHKIDVLHEHCRAVGRDPSEIELSVFLRQAGDSAKTYDAMVRAGSPIVAAERERLLAEGVSGAGLDERVREAVLDLFLPDDDGRAIERLKQYVSIGVTHFIIMARPPFDHARLQWIIERIAPHVK